MRWPSGSMQLNCTPQPGVPAAGIRLPGNGWPVIGSLMTCNVALFVVPKRVCEKSPLYSSPVGMFARVVDVGRASSTNSCEPKK